MGPVLHFIGVLLIFLGLFMLVPAAWALYYQEAEIKYFILSAVITFVLGLLFRRFSDPSAGIQIREGFAIVGLGWVAIVLFGSLPYLISGAIPSLTDAIFESTSGFTTTGASILSDVEVLPKSVLFWRSFTHWLGGMGIIVFTLAILPILGIGGMQLYKAEITGPTKDKLTPRISQTAKLLWGVYTLMTLAETILLVLCGMNLFDALCHSFGTVATGGFSTRNASIAAFDNPWIHWVIILFMFLAGANFALHYRAMRGHPLAHWREPEFRFYGSALLVGVVVILVSSWSRFEPARVTIRDAFFVVVSQGTCTGFTTADYERWHPLAILTLIVLMFLGGMVGSTSGGLKTMRWVIIMKSIQVEIRRLIHPSGVYPIRFGSKLISDQAATNILAFSLLYVVVFLAGGGLLVGLGLDYSTSFGSSIACLSGVGPGIGLVGPTENYNALPDPAKWTLIAEMYLGRLELLTVMALFSRGFWRK